MPLLGDPGGVTDQDFLTDDSAQQQPLPDAPDFARVIPLSSLQDAKQQQVAQDWGDQQRAELAQQWGDMARSDLNGIWSRYQDMQDVPPDGMVAPNLGESVEPILSETGTQQQGSPEDQGQTQTIDPSQGQPGFPGSAPNPTGTLTPVSSDQNTPITLDTLAQLFRKAVGQGAAGAGLVDLTNAPKDIGEAAKNAAQAEANRSKPLMGPGGPTLYNPNTPAGGSDVAGALGLGEEVAAGSAPEARLASAGENGASALDSLASIAGKGVASVGEEGAATTERAPAVSPETLSKVPEVLQPHVEQAAAKLGMDDEQVAKALDIATDPSQLDRIMRTKNASRDLSAGQQAARNLLKEANKTFIAQAATEDTQAAEQVIPEAAQMANPDPSLLSQLEQSVRNAGGTVEPRQPIWAGIGQADLEDRVAAQEADQAAQRTALEPGPMTLPSGRIPGGIDAQATAERTAAEQQSVNNAARAVNRANLQRGAEEIAAQEPPRATIEDIKDRTPLWFVDKTDQAASDALVRDAARDIVGGGEPPHLPSGRSVGGPGTPPPPGRAGRIAQGLARPVLQQGAFAAGAAYGWQEDTSDDLTHHVANALLRGAEASTLAYGLGGGAPKEIPGRMLEAFIGNLISPKTAGMKFTQDAANALVTGPAIHFLTGLIESARGQEGASFAQTARESGAMWSTLVGSSAAWRAGLQDVRDIMSGATSMSHTLNEIPGTSRLGAADAGRGILGSLAQPGKSAAQLGPRMISAVTAFFQRVMYAQEMARETVAAAGTLRHQTGLDFTSEAMAERAWQRTQARLLMGQPEGGIGRVAIDMTRLAQNTPLLGGRILTPFARIPVNFADRTLSGIPLLGLLNVPGSKDPNAIVARQILGTVLLSGAWMLFGDRIHGNGPPDPTVNKSLRENDGFLPYSVRDPQSGLQVEIRKFPGELKGALMALGAINDVQRYGADPQKMGQYIKSFGETLGTADGITRLINAYENGMTASQIASEVSSVGPWYAKQPQQASKPYAVDTKGTALLPPAASMGDKMKAGAVTGLQEAGAPGVGQPAPKLQPATGEPTPNEAQGAGGVLNPFGTSTLRDNAVADAFAAAHVNIPPAPSKLSYAGKDVELSGEATRYFEQQRGQYLSEHLPANLSAVRAESLLEQARSAAERATRQQFPDLFKGAQSNKTAAQARQTDKWGSWGAAKGTAGPATATPARRPAAATSAAGAGWGSWGK